METRTSETSHLLVWIAAISLIVFCGLGVAALMGWIPISVGKPEVPVLAEPVLRAAPVALAAPCTGCGVVQSVRKVQAKGKAKGSGLGAVGGAAAGNEIEERVTPANSFEITVDLDDGTSRVITEAIAPSWRNGDKVRIVNGVIESNA